MVSIPDPNWVRPLMSVPDHSWLPPEGSSETEPPLVDAPDLDAVHPLIEVEDTKAVAPLIEVENPACSLPAAAELVEVHEEDYHALLAAQTEGRQIQATPAGDPEAVDPSPLPPEELEYRERLWRDAALSVTDAMVVRHRDEIEAERDTTLTAEQYREVQAYRVALRTWPESPDFPASAQRPTPPAWLSSTTS